MRARLFSNDWRGERTRFKLQPPPKTGAASITAGWQILDAEAGEA